MTGRTVRPDVLCCVLDCGALGAYHMDGLVYGETDPHRASPPLEIQTGLVVCQAHRDNPPQTAREFFSGEQQRDFLDHACAASGKVRPNYASAVWYFPPMQKPDTEAAH